MLGLPIRVGGGLTPFGISSKWNECRLALILSATLRLSELVAANAWLIGSAKRITSFNRKPVCG
jgi:hypothetical protein